MRAMGKGIGEEAIGIDESAVDETPRAVTDRMIGEEADGFWREDGGARAAKRRRRRARRTRT